MAGRKQPELEVSWKIELLTPENDPDGSRQRRQFQAIVNLIQGVSKRRAAAETRRTPETPQTVTSL